MKTKFCILFSLLFMIFMTGCTPEGFYEKEFLEAMVKANRNNYCEIDTSKSTDAAAMCEAQSGCQALLDVDLNYLSCIPILTPYSESVADVGNTEGSDETSNEGGLTDEGESSDSDGVAEETVEDEENPGQEFSYVCGEADHKVLTCHFPSGDSSKARTLCIALKGWENGHSSHAGDHLGACNNNDF